MNILKLITLFSLVPTCFSSITVINKTGYKMLTMIDKESNFEILEDNEIFHQSSSIFDFLSKHSVGVLLVPNDYTKNSYYFADTLSFFGLWRKDTDIVKLGKDTLMKYEDLNNLPTNRRSLVVPDWYANKNHILVVYGGINQPLAFYSCRDEKYYPRRTEWENKLWGERDYAKGTNVCEKFDTGKGSGKYKLPNDFFDFWKELQLEKSKEKKSREQKKTRAYWILKNSLH